MFCDKIFCAEKFADIYHVVAHQLILRKEELINDFPDFSGPLKTPGHKI
jgi:hypothetical protein